MKRKSISKTQSKAMFKRSADRVNRKNLINPAPILHRGGYSL